MSRTEHSGERFTDISELFEGISGQCLQARTESLGTRIELLMGRECQRIGSARPGAHCQELTIWKDS
jgi:hypothetical protein